jgi:oxalate decarboxylase/phosphoglucose isomerase-like protein (cupin superfamily)
MRELHWHPNADVGLVRRNLGHYVENTGDDDLIFIETFGSDHYEEVSLANWLSHLRAARRESCRCRRRVRRRDG